ncbi:N-glycosylase/DNA lyase [Cucumispora dikerogammari]|nr:N-glycosylase/DNA lyase [Cucumispora dikerogammari]
MMAKKYKTFKSKQPIDLEMTLKSGQCFSFKLMKYGYVGSINQTLYVLRNVAGSVFEEENEEDSLYNIEYICLDKERSTDQSEKDLYTFFNLHLDYTKIKNRIKGLCILKIDLLECIFSFICSSNNQIKRITQMVTHLFSFGSSIIFNNEAFYMFPDLMKLTNIEEKLVELKFGYRAKYICETARLLLSYDLDLLKRSEYTEVFNKLVKLKGVGAKVADCICLYSFGWFSVVPVDVHIFKRSKEMFALKENYDVDEEGKKKNKKITLNKKTMKLIQEKWKEEFGELAGVVQLFIFYRSVNKVI